MKTVESCKREQVTNNTHNSSTSSKINLLGWKKIDASQNDQKQLKRTAASFIPPPIEHHDPSRIEHAVGLLSAAAEAAELGLGPHQPKTLHVQCSRFSVCAPITKNRKKFLRQLWQRYSNFRFCNECKRKMMKISFSLATK